MAKSFAEVKDDLAPDGALRDFYILDVVPSDWDRFLAAVPSIVERVVFTRDDKDVTIPSSFARIWAMKEETPESTTLMTMWVSGQTVCCHFFCDSEIELDFLPNAVDTEQRWNHLRAFFQYVVDTIGKKGIITHENMQDFVIEEIVPTKIAEPRHTSDAENPRL